MRRFVNCLRPVLTEELFALTERERERERKHARNYRRRLNRVASPPAVHPRCIIKVSNIITT